MSRWGKRPGTIRTIRDVRHVEGLKKNLLSLGQLDDLGCKVEIQNKIIKIISGAFVLMRGEKVAANLYQLKGEIIEEAEASVASHSLSHRVAVTWYQKLGHMSEQGMKILVERKLLLALTKVYSNQEEVDVFEVSKFTKRRLEEIKRQFTTGITLIQLNGSAERHEQNLLERAKSDVGILQALENHSGELG
ncbi:hypothetical protein Tco_0175297 [Tanacetum coccineum]